jgi:hypothetical protein
MLGVLGYVLETGEVGMCVDGGIAGPILIHQPSAAHDVDLLTR